MLRTSPLAPIAILAAGLAAMTACGISADMEASMPGAPASDYAEAWDAAAAKATTSTSPTGNAPRKLGSLLCGTKHNDFCVPDEPHACDPPDGGAAYMDAGSSVDAAAPVLDASAASDAGLTKDGGALACRVTKAGTAEVQPVCGAAGEGVDGAECRVPSDCAAGFECVGTPGQCRRYCCISDATCGADRACDKLPITDSQLLVPVCIPVRACKLLAKSGCPEGETCAIVDQSDGRTSCVATGTAGIGESCELANCAAGLTCLGAPDERTCFKLCSKSRAGDCPADYKCKGAAPLFQDADQGVCLPEASAQGANGAWR